MRATKDLAKQQVDVYGDLLQQRAVITDIAPTEKRGETCYSFEILGHDFPYTVECLGIKQLALVLTTMWSAYEKAWNDSGFIL